MIKSERITDEQKLKNINNELIELSPCLLELADFFEIFEDLKATNESLWDIENKIREKEIQKCFDEDFIELARSVYKYNDERARLKRLINLQSESNFIEEKSYT